MSLTALDINILNTPTKKSGLTHWIKIKIQLSCTYKRHNLDSNTQTRWKGNNGKMYSVQTVTILNR